MSEFDFAGGTPPSGRSLAKRRKQSKWQAIIAGVAAVALLGIAAAVIVWLQPKPFMALRPIADQQTAEMSGLRFTPVVDIDAFDAKLVRFELLDAPEGAAINAESGAFSWIPTEEQGPGEFTIRLAVTGPDGLRDEKSCRVAVTEVNRPPVIQPIAEQSVSLDDATVARVVVRATDPDVPEQVLSFTLPPSELTGLTIDPESGEFTWDPRDAQPGKSYRFTVLVADDAAKPAEAKSQFIIQVTADDRPVATLARALRSGGAKVERLEKEKNKHLAQECEVLAIDGQPVHIVEYETAEAAVSAVGLISADGAMVFGQPQEWTAPGHLYHADRLIVLYEGQDEAVISTLSSALGQPFAQAEVGAAPAPSTPDDEPTSFTTGDPTDEQVVELYRQKKLFLPSNYPTLRGLYADRFARRFADQIKAAFGDHHDKMMAWLDEHHEIKDDLYTAIHPEYDDVAGALAVFQQLKEQFPDKIVPYAQLAIATSVVWDKEGPGVYDYLDHAARTKSSPVEPRLAAIDNFQYFLDAEQMMQGRAQHLPWEFLTHLVDHRTPLAERKWALENYLPKRVKFGTCYSDVPYDTIMLESGDQTCRLAGKDYSLPNIKQFGGVCAMQADFAARVGKSLGVPAMYVHGESQFGQLHAWVMWVELTNVSQSKIGFSLDSHGRYNLDQYYVGGLTDPQTGQETTDRALELKLHAIGVNPQARRHADFLMQAYPALRQEALSGVTDHITFLREVIKLSPGNGQAWTAVAGLASEGVVTQKQSKLMTSLLGTMFSTFGHFPDFTWTIFDDFVSFQPEAKQRAKYYERLVGLYESAGRPDLACEARLKLTDIVVESGKPADAIEGLAATVMKFPQEGRYVPRLLDRLEAICQDVKAAGKGAADTDKQLVAFYQGFLPKVPRLRGNEPSPYCISMYERAVARFRELNEEQLAQACETELAAILASKQAATR